MSGENLKAFLIFMCGFVIVVFGIPALVNLHRFLKTKKERKEHPNFYYFVSKHQTNYDNFLKTYYHPMKKTKELIDEMLEKRKYVPTNKLTDFDVELEELKTEYQKELANYEYHKYIINLDKEAIDKYRKENHLTYI